MVWCDAAAPLTAAHFSDRALGKASGKGLREIEQHAPSLLSLWHKCRVNAFSADTSVTY
jgi:hypothetical protein